MKRKALILLFFVGFSLTSKSQILISLLFGEKLNSPKIEFGMTGGINRSYFNDIKESEGLNNFNLGFYFHVSLKNNSYLSTGVLVKSNMGATGMGTYPIGNTSFDSIYEGGTLTTRINYFYVPVLFQQRLYKRIIVEGGFQAGLRSKASDTFTLSSFEGDLEYETEVKEKYKYLDVGLLGGVGFKVNNHPKSMSIGVNYYYGLVNVSAQSDVTIKNSSVYVYMKIPIGVGAEKPKTE